MEKIGKLIDIALISLCTLDFASSYVTGNSVGGYLTRRFRETVQSEQPENVKVGYRFGKKILSDETVGKTIDGTVILLSGLYLLKSLTEKPKSSRKRNS